MRRSILVAGGVFSLAAMVALVVLAISAWGSADRDGRVAEARDVPPVYRYLEREADLEISGCSHGRISGVYTGAGSVVSFSSRLADDWRGPSPSRESLRDDDSGSGPWVTARVEVGGKVFRWTDDPRRRLSIFDGPDTALTEEESEVLVAAGDAVWRHALYGEIGSWDRRSKLTREQLWLTVALGYISEAPPGYAITDDAWSTRGAEQTEVGQKS